MRAASRIERDSFGTIAVPGDALWGAQTQRSLHHFGISTERMPAELVAALALVIILAQSVALLLMFDEMEEEFIDNLLTTQVEHSIELWHTSPETAFPNTPSMTLYRLEPHSPPGSVPDNLARLPIGNHEMFEGDKEFHVAVREDADLDQLAGHGGFHGPAAVVGSGAGGGHAAAVGGL